MRIIKIIILLIIIATIGYGYVWYKHSSNSRDILIAKIAEINSAGLDKQDFQISYDEIKAGGFPFGVKLSLVNPEITYNNNAVTHWLTNFNKMELTKTEDGKSKDKSEKIVFSDRIKIAGEIALYGNYFTQNIEVDLSGVATGNSQFNDKKLNWASNADYSSKCSLGLTKEASFSILENDFFINFQDMESVFDKIKSFGCESKNFTMIDSDTNENLLSIVDETFSFASKNFSNGTKDIKLKLSIVDFLSSQKLDEWYESLVEYYKKYFAQYYSGIEVAEDVDLPAETTQKEYVSLGKQNVNIDIHYNGAVDFSVVQVGSLKLDVNKFIFQNNLLDINMPMNILIDRKQNTEKMSLKINGYKDFKAGSTAYVKNLYKSMFSEYYKQNSKQVGVKYQPEKVNEMIEAFVPDLESLGKIDVNIDVAYDSVSDPQGFDNKKDVQINLAEIKNKDYGVRASGEFSLLKIASNVAVRCFMCDKLIDDALGYYGRTEVFFLEDGKKPVVNDRFIKLVKAFVSQVSIAEDLGETLLITVTDNGKNELLISDKSMFDFFMLWSQVFLPETVKGYNSDGSKPAEIQSLPTPK